MLPTDAEFVDVIHTNSGDLLHGAVSLPEPVGKSIFRFPAELRASLVIAFHRFCPRVRPVYPKIGSLAFLCIPLGLSEVLKVP